MAPKSARKDPTVLPSMLMACEAAESRRAMVTLTTADEEFPGQSIFNANRVEITNDLGFLRLLSTRSRSFSEIRNATEIDRRIARSLASHKGAGRRRENRDRRRGGNGHRRVAARGARTQCWQAVPTSIAGIKPCV